MAQVERNAEQKKAGKREQAKAKREGSRRNSGKVELDLRKWSGLVCLTELLIEHDGALRIGFTRDGGALALGVYMGDDYATEYIRPAEDFWIALSEIAGVWVTDGEVRLGELYVGHGFESWEDR